MTSFLLILLALLAPATAHAAEISGPASFKDADSLFVGKRQVRLAGLDAPEWYQVCKLAGKDWRAGQEAAAWVKSQYESKHLHCTTDGKGRYKRAVATCYADGTNINEAIVSAGWAVAYRRYSVRYVSHESNAKTAGRGMWAGDCQEPEAWRHSKRAKK